MYQNSITHKVLSSDLKAGMLNHCYLISSRDEMFLQELAFFMAKEINCLNKNAPCDACINCEKINHNNMVDLAVFPKDNKNLMVDDVAYIVEDSMVRPIESKHKIYILKNFDKCTIQAQNKILKTLEEPPHNVVFILTCTNLQQVLTTIQSRAKKIEEMGISTQIMLEYLSENKVDNPELIASIADGNITTAIKISENNDAIAMVKLAFDMLLNLRSTTDILKYSSKILLYKKDITFFLDTLIKILRDISIVGVAENISFKSFEKELKMLNGIYTAQVLQLITEKICVIYDKLEFNCNIVGVIDQLLLDILEVKYLCQK